MTSVKVTEACAFSRGETGGNPAGVVLDAQKLSDEEMQKIAKAINFSETAFVVKKSPTEFDVRFFTPTTEVSMCGHATIAAGYCISKKGLTKELNFVFNTKSGIVPVAVDKDMVTFKIGPLSSVDINIDLKEVTNALGIGVSDVNNKLPVCAVRVEQYPDLVLPVKTLTAMKNIKPDFEKLSAVFEKFKLAGLNAFSFETLYDESLIHARCFFPTLGINEDPATGISTAILGYYFLNNKIVGSESEFISEQGYELETPSRIVARIDGTESVHVGGSVVIVREREVRV